jgi:hypothetical protein
MRLLCILHLTKNRKNKGSGEEASRKIHPFSYKSGISGLPLSTSAHNKIEV